MSEQKHQDDVDAPPRLREVLGAVFAAAIGIRSREDQERDFRRGSAAQYVVVGVIATLLFVAVVFGVVKFVLAIAVGEGG